MDFSDSINSIKGIGEKTANNYKKLNIETVGDLLSHFPRAYDKYSDIQNIGTLVAGENAIIKCKLVKTPVVKYYNKRSSTHVMVEDYSGQIELIWYNMPFLKNSLHLGAYYIFRGNVDLYKGKRVMRQPLSIGLKEFDKDKKKLLPIYPLTAGVSNKSIKKSVDYALHNVSFPEEKFSNSFLKKYNIITKEKAIKCIHNPKNDDDYVLARRRLVFDEFFTFMYGIHKLKSEKKLLKTDVKIDSFNLSNQLIDSLDFELTEDQLKCFEDIKSDFLSGNVMNRLIQGDVGCGKTVVALLAMLAAVENGYQAVIMVPTQVLAVQHFETINQMLERLKTKGGRVLYGKDGTFSGGKKPRTVLLTGKMRAKEKREAYELIETGVANIIVGTHALIQEEVNYRKLALVITDEQHRFGVRQRDMLKDKGKDVHVLVMSATPIPRTLSLMLYGDLDISVIKSMPLNRKPIKNCVVGTSYRPAAYKFIEKEVKSGHQAYIICPMIGSLQESEVPIDYRDPETDVYESELENCIEYTENLRKVLPMWIRVEYVHGKMDAKEKEDVLKRFSNGDIDVLVSTTVIEVGINVPNATLMYIENAERFGLATLHQLRGRVGRSDLQSYCIFMYGKTSVKTQERLSVLNESNDGFYIANEDLRQRGPGDVLGVKQSGEMEFKLGDIYNDNEILKTANEAVQEMIRNDKT
ncbi:MAG: ATP-dependent DNA helicase RecG [Lachnospiraceae bacterium]|nr:ATP-dependent DNA helicase RecG [Lachnospiraceae bacterium]